MTEKKNSPLAKSKGPITNLGNLSPGREPILYIKPLL